jgi:hypothetical protein
LDQLALDGYFEFGLKIKESVLQGEPFHAAAPSEMEQEKQQQQLNIQSELDEVAKGARRFASSLSKGAKGITMAFSPRTSASSKPAAVSNGNKKPTKNKVTKTTPTGSPGLGFFFECRR